MRDSKAQEDPFFIFADSKNLFVKVLCTALIFIVVIICVLRCLDPNMTLKDSVTAACSIVGVGSVAVGFLSALWTNQYNLKVENRKEEERNTQMKAHFIENISSNNPIKVFSGLVGLTSICAEQACIREEKSTASLQECIDIICEKIRLEGNNKNTSIGALNQQNALKVIKSLYSYSSECIYTANWLDCECSFKNVRFLVPVNFSNCQFRSSLEFINCHFTDDVSLAQSYVKNLEIRGKSRFNNDFTLYQMIIDKCFQITGECEFAGKINAFGLKNLGDIEICGKASTKNEERPIVFREDVDFSSSKFCSEPGSSFNFENVRFEKHVSFFNCRFESENSPVCFREIECNQSICFNGAYFATGLNLHSVDVNEDFVFNGVKFKYTDYTCTTIKFYKVIVQREVSFDEVTFPESVREHFESDTNQWGSEAFQSGSYPWRRPEFKSDKDLINK